MTPGMGLHCWGACATVSNQIGGFDLRNYLLVACLLLGGLTMPGTSPAHHSVFAEYDINGSVTIEGVVTEVWFKSPHIRIYIDVVDADGNTVSWNTHGHNPTMLRRNGWSRNSIKPGDKVVASGDPTYNGSPKMFLRRIELEDGRVFLNEVGRP